MLRALVRDDGPHMGRIDDEIAARDAEGQELHTILIGPLPASLSANFGSRHIRRRSRLKTSPELRYRPGLLRPIPTRGWQLSPRSHHAGSSGPPSPAASGGAFGENLEGFGRKTIAARPEPEVRARQRSENRCCANAGSTIPRAQGEEYRRAGN